MIGAKNSGWFTVALALLAGSGCGADHGNGPAPIRVLTASSAADAVRECGDAFTAETHVEVQVVGDDSGKLANQIAQGAPADLFLSANEQWAEFVRSKGYVLESTLLLGNTLVLIAPAGNTASLTGPIDLTGPAVKKMALAGPSVPAGIYARQALAHLHLLERLEAEKKIVSGENVRAALAYVERGEVDAGIVFGTDAKITDKVRVIKAFPAESHAPIVYPLVLLRRDAANGAGRRFYDYLQAGAAAAVFRAHGFIPIGR